MDQDQDRSGRRVRTGLERLADDGFRTLAGQRVGILTNHTGVLAVPSRGDENGPGRPLQHAVDLLHTDDRVELVAIFGPEHGFRGTVQAATEVGQAVDARTGLPVYDTFEVSGEPLVALIESSGVDTIVVDLADIGARFYTYIWSLFDLMEAAAALGRRIVVLDRPNAIGGHRALGPVLHPEFASFVGREAISLVHGMTMGELAQLFAAEFLPPRMARPVGRPAVEVEVVAMEGWQRDQIWSATGLPWIAPSPNLPTLETALVYPGSCLLSGTNLSQGRGTTRPFQLVGAPFVDHRLAAELTAQGLPGLAFREAHFVPTFSTYAGQNCGGIDVSVDDWTSLDPVQYGVSLLLALRQLYPDQFSWRDDGSAAEPRFWIDHLTGSELVREGVDAGRPAAEICAGWQQELQEFTELRNSYLRY